MLAFACTTAQGLHVSGQFASDKLTMPPMLISCHLVWQRMTVLTHPACLPNQGRQAFHAYAAPSGQLAHAIVDVTEITSGSSRRLGPICKPNSRAVKVVLSTGADTEPQCESKRPASKVFKANVTSRRTECSLYDYLYDTLPHWGRTFAVTSS